MSIALLPVNFLQIAYASVMVFSIFLVFGQKQYKALTLLLAIHALIAVI